MTQPAPSAPPVIPPRPPVFPAASPSAAPQPFFNAGMLRFYRISCGLFVLMYLGLVGYSVLITRGMVEPPLTVMEELDTHNDPAARAQAIAEERKRASGLWVPCVIGALFYAWAAFVPRKPWGWKLGLIAIIAMFFPFCITIVLMIPLLVFWLKPETKGAFQR